MSRVPKLTSMNDVTLVTLPYGHEQLDQPIDDGTFLQIDPQTFPVQQVVIQVSTATMLHYNA
jgi:hypothetical protein